MSMETGTRLSVVAFSRDTVMATNGVLALASAEVQGEENPARVAQEAGGDIREVWAVLGRLRKAGLLRAGRNGFAPYRLTRSPDQVTLYDIAAAVGEPFECCCCLEQGAAGRRPCGLCLLDAVCKQVREDVITLFKTRTVSDLLAARA